MRNLWKMQKPPDRAAVANKGLKMTQALEALSREVLRTLTQPQSSTNCTANSASTVKAL